MKQAPSDHLFVVDVDFQRRDQAVKRLASLGGVKPLEGNERLLLLTIAPSSLDAESVWSRARELLGDLGSVHPVLIDELGEPHFPTGEISVRFHEVPPDDQLKEFAAEHGLRLRDRNEYVPQQAVFQLVDSSSRYLPKLVQELAETHEARAAWANTLARFHRAHGA